ncbi:kynureninase [Litorihabitans aurantiacus]|uniref:kynureninase n=1 Tax=Litorihabitans aurantiacus TaxID=1930061 RepID=UPI003D678B34
MTSPTPSPTGPDDARRAAPSTSRALDGADALEPLRDLFVGSSSGVVYLDGNSLGRPLRATATSLAAFVTEQWGGRLIRGWDEGWSGLPLTLGDDLGRVALGAAPGQTWVGDSTTVTLYKLLRAAVAAQRGEEGDGDRDEIVIDTDNFPTDRYVVEGVARECGMTVRWLPVSTSAGVDVAGLAEVLSERTAVVVLSQVAYRSGWLADVAAITAAVHDVGGLVLWDLCHSVGSVPIELDAHGVDLAVGCTYKYLNGGPGSPAFGYVARRHQERLAQPIQGWMGHADPFAMGPRYAPASGPRRYLSGTPPILGMLAMRDMVALLDEVGIAAVRAKSLALTEHVIALTDERLAPLGVTLASPRDGDRRGGHVTLTHPRMREVVTALWQRDVLPDYRDPHGLRIGLSPLSTSFAEAEAGVDAVAEVLRDLAG